MTKIIISDDAARAMVKAGTVPITKSVQKVSKIQDAPQSDDDIRLAALASSWTQNSAGLWVATANFIVNDAIDTEFTFNVAAPTASNNPGGTIGTSRFFVIWRGRWEMIASTGLTIAQVDAEINSILSSKYLTHSFVYPIGFERDGNGYLTIGTALDTIKYYGEQ